MDKTINEGVNNTDILEKSPVSERKLQANRRNAKKSTGPRTKGGKGYSRMNAIKHGFYAEKAKLTLCGEEEAEFSDLCAEMRFELSTSGVLEELEAERIAMFHWKL